MSTIINDLFSHSDPLIRGNTIHLIGSVLIAAMKNNTEEADILSSDHESQQQINIHNLLQQLLASLDDNSSIVTRMGAKSLGRCLKYFTNIHSPHLYPSNVQRALIVIKKLLASVNIDTYWLVKIEVRHFVDICKCNL